ncbi:MAG: TRAP transporter small permease [Saccharospirillum sp.]|nr:TRAP transporter small permease [Saccharospirillum sp.]
MSFSNVLTGFATWVERIAGLFLAIVTVLVFASAGARYLLSSPIPDAHAFASLLLGVALLWGLASASWRDEHIAVDLLYTGMSDRLKRFVDIFGQILILMFVGLFCWMLLKQVGSVRSSGDLTVDTRTAIWPFYFMAWLGVAAATILILARLFLLVFNPKGLPTKKSVADEAAENAGEPV